MGNLLTMNMMVETRGHPAKESQGNASARGPAICNYHFERESCQYEELDWPVTIEQVPLNC